jgi:hypothetical protein
MSQKKVLEFDAKRILSRWLHDYSENEHSATTHIIRVSAEVVAGTSYHAYRKRLTRSIRLSIKIE